MTQFKLMNHNLQSRASQAAYDLSNEKLQIIILAGGTFREIIEGAGEVDNLLLALLSEEMSQFLSDTVN